MYVTVFTKHMFVTGTINNFPLVIRRRGEAVFLHRACKILDVRANGRKCLMAGTFSLSSRPQMSYLRKSFEDEG